MRSLPAPPNCLYDLSWRRTRRRDGTGRASPTSHLSPTAATRTHHFDLRRGACGRGRRIADPSTVILTIMTFGPEPDAEVLATAVEPVDGYVEELSQADEVRATLIHQTAGGLHH